MLIRCEKCSTLYELDDKLLPPQGAPVQCSKCQFVFKAYPAPEPPRAPAEPEAPSDAGSASDAAHEVVREGGALAGGIDARPAATPPPVPPRAATRPVTPAPGASSAGGDQQFTADGRPIRKVAFPAPEPLPPGTRPMAVRSATHPARSGAGDGIRWAIVALVVVAILVAAILAWRATHHRGSRAAQAFAPAGESLPRQQGGTTEALARK